MSDTEMSNAEETTTYSVVELADGLEVIPNRWIRGDICKYPNWTSSQKIKKAALNNVLPESDWKSWKIIRIFGTYESFVKANEKVKLAEYMSDLNTDHDEKSNRKQRAKRKISSSSESDEDNSQIPKFPEPPVSKRLECAPSPVNSIVSDISHCRSPISLQLEQFTPNSCASFTAHTSSYASTPIRRNIRVGRISHRRQKDPSPERHPCSPVGDSAVRGKKLLQDTRIAQTPHETAECLKKLSRDVILIKYQLQHATDMIETLVKRVMNGQSNPPVATAGNASLEEIEEMFPLKSVEEVDQLETIIKTDKDKRCQVIAFLKTIGGSTVDDLVKRALYKIFTNEVAMSFNWEGRLGKRSLSSLQIFKILFNIILEALPGESDSKKIELRVKEWYRHAKARKANQDKKAAKPQHG